MFGRERGRSEESKQWETNWYSIRGDVLAYWASEEEAVTEEKKQRPLGVLFLKNAAVSKYPHIDNAIEVRSKEWMRKGDYHRSEHAFKLLPKSASEGEKWMASLKEATSSGSAGKRFIHDISTCVLHQ